MLKRANQKIADHFRRPNGDQFALLVISIFFVLRLWLAMALGFGSDEAYMLTQAHHLDLSYFDHPPLHVWLAHLSILMFGVTFWVRLPFILLFAGTGLFTYLAVKKIYNRTAAIYTLVSLNAAPFFLASAGGWIVPDGPLMFALSSFFWLATKLLFQRDSEVQNSIWIWIAIGFSIGLAILSKYSAILVLPGFGAFLLFDESARRQLMNWGPYLALTIVSILILPIILWNAEHQFVSIAFQTGRGLPTHNLTFSNPAIMAIGELLYLYPWIAVLTLIAVARGLKLRNRCALFLTSLGAPMILVFTILPLWGARGLPHWPMPGWYFLLPILGHFFSEFAHQKSWPLVTAVSSAALSIALVALLSWHSMTGGLCRFEALCHAGDPLADVTNWTELWEQPELQDLQSGAAQFIATTNWSDGGKIGIATGLQFPVALLSSDPRGFAFTSPLSDFVRRNAIIILRAGRATQLDQFRSYFESIDPPRLFTLRAGTSLEQRLLITRAIKLLKPFDLPYGADFETSRRED